MLASVRSENGTIDSESMCRIFESFRPSPDVLAFLALALVGDFMAITCVCSNLINSSELLVYLHSVKIVLFVTSIFSQEAAYRVLVTHGIRDVRTSVSECIAVKSSSSSRIP